MHNTTKSSGPSQVQFIALMALLTATAALSIDAMLPALGQIGKSLNADSNQIN
ncbi:hypothetical protein [Neptunomonas sp.]|uniref:hypothetical protein n=1 Tax=Neptunomonas sp. TaxID=1971898 RepID=UPI003568405E